MLACFQPLDRSVFPAVSGDCYLCLLSLYISSNWSFGLHAGLLLGLHHPEAIRQDLAFAVVDIPTDDAGKIASQAWAIHVESECLAFRKKCFSIGLLPSRSVVTSGCLFRQNTVFQGIAKQCSKDMEHWPIR